MNNEKLMYGIEKYIALHLFSSFYTRNILFGFNVILRRKFFPEGRKEKKGGFENHQRKGSSGTI